MNSSENGPATTVAAPAPPQLLRVLGCWEATAIVVGIMIGTGIFIVPAQITRSMGTRDAALSVWAVTGLLSLFGALSFAELAAMMPQAGGQYVYLREAYGPLTGYLCGWSFFIAAQTGGISVLAVGFAEYTHEFISLTPWEQKAAAAASIVVLTAINYAGVREGGALQSILTGVKVGAIAAITLLGYALVKGFPAASAPLAAPTGHRWVASFGVAMVGAFWAYEGWNACTFAAGEVKRPERNVPLALILGTVAVIMVYLALNLVYYHVLSMDEVARSSRVGADAAVRIFGRTGSYLVSLLIIISTLGSLNGSILAAPRVYYAMARDGLFFRWCARVHPRFHTPHVALLVQGVWAIVLVAAGTYEQLFTYVIFAAFVFYALTALAVVVLRHTMPDAPRPYRVFGYPYVPIIFVLGSAWFLLNTLMEEPVEAGCGAVMLGLGVLVYGFWKRRAARGENPSAVPPLYPV
ncbi:MAG TPA: amino acid permease [Terriglobia bacterium]|nr:amino acid permease [Terriglobia bacterium]